MRLRYLKLDTIRKLAVTEKVFVEEEPPLFLSFRDFWPIFIQATPDNYRLWYGYKLLLAVPSQLTRIKIFFWGKDADHFQILQQIASWLRLWRELYPLEIARLTQLIEENTPTDRLTQTFFQLTGQKNFADWQKYYPSILNLHPIVQEYLTSHKAPLKIWLLFAGFTSSDQKFVAQIIQRYAPTLSQSIIIVKLLQDLLALDPRSLGEVWSSIFPAEAEGIGTAADKAMIQEIIASLRRRRYPQLTTYNDKLIRLRRQLPSRPQVQISWDDTFESGTLNISCQLQQASDLKVLHELTNQTNLQVLQQMLDLL